MLISCLRVWLLGHDDEPVIHVDLVRDSPGPEEAFDDLAFRCWPKAASPEG